MTFPRYKHDKWMADRACNREIVEAKGGAALGLFKRFIQQTGKPEGLLGEWMLASMNRGHAKVADWGLTKLKEIDPGQVIDLGCGGGRNVHVLLEKYPKAMVLGLDYSPLSIAEASSYNEKAFASGRCSFQQADVSDLTMMTGQYDLATAFETIYFWPGLAHCFSEVARILRPGAHFLIVNESNGQDAIARRFESMIDGMTLYTAEAIETALRQAGFFHVTIHQHPKKSWLCVLAEK